MVRWETFAIPVSHTGNPLHILLRQNVSFQIVDFEWNIVYVSHENNSIYRNADFFNIYILVHACRSWLKKLVKVCFYHKSKVGSMSWAMLGTGPKIVADSSAFKDRYRQTWSFLLLRAGQEEASSGPEIICSCISLHCLLSGWASQQGPYATSWWCIHGNFQIKVGSCAVKSYMKFWLYRPLAQEHRGSVKFPVCTKIVGKRAEGLLSVWNNNMCLESPSSSPSGSPCGCVLDLPAVGQAGLWLWSTWFSHRHTSWHWSGLS